MYPRCTPDPVGYDGDPIHSFVAVFLACRRVVEAVHAWLFDVVIMRRALPLPLYDIF